MSSKLHTRGRGTKRKILWINNRHFKPVFVQPILPMFQFWWTYFTTHDRMDNCHRVWSSYVFTSENALFIRYIFSFPNKFTWTHSFTWKSVEDYLQRLRRLPPQSPKSVLNQSLLGWDTLRLQLRRIRRRRFCVVSYLLARAPALAGWYPRKDGYGQCLVSTFWVRHFAAVRQPP